jgi:tol-pal system-associated acyl-CoA thioesterase
VKEFGCPVRVYIEDTDAGGIVYYVNYLKYMERARTEFMRQLGYDKNFIFSTDKMFVVHTADIRYHKPARLDDELTAMARIAESGAAQLVFAQRVVRGGEDLCSGRVRIVCVDRQTLKPRRIPGTLLAALRQIEVEERAE